MVIGVVMVVMPFAFNMFNRAPKGAAMLSQFKPFMTPTRLDGFQKDIALVNAGVHQTAGPVAACWNGTQGHSSFATHFSSFELLNHQWPSIYSTMTTLLDKVQSNLPNYHAVAALPSFKLFPWFFVIPGLIFTLCGLVAWRRPNRAQVARIVAVAVGIGLIGAPVAFQMFQRAPKGAQMMGAFTTIETNANVENIQNYFATMAEGQGAIRVEVVPALESHGLSASDLNKAFPAVATLDRQWIHILNDMTPMIGAMSDSVVDYQAIASLPSFELFPWFFVGPGLVVAGVALVGGRRRRHSSPPTIQGASS